MLRKNKRKKIFLLGSYHGNNLGDLEILDSILEKFYKDFDITVLTKSKYKVTSKLSSQYFDEGKISFVHPYNIFKILWKLIRTNLVLIGGGGLFFSYNFFDTLRITGKSQLLFWIKLTLLAAILGKKVFWFGVGFGPFDSFGKFLVKVGGLFVKKIYCRDSQSYTLLKEIINENKLYLSSDIVYTKVEPWKVKKYLDKSKSEINSVLLVTFEKDNLKELNYMIKELQNNNYKLFIASTNPDKDNKFNRELAEASDLLFIDTSSMNLAEFRNMFSRFDLVVSMRMHALLVGYQQGLIGIGLSKGIPKIEELQKQLYEAEFFDDNYQVIELIKELHNKMTVLKIKSIKNYENNFNLANSAFEDIIKEIR